MAYLFKRDENCTNSLDMNMLTLTHFFNTSRLTGYLSTKFSFNYAGVLFPINKTCFYRNACKCWFHSFLFTLNHGLSFSRTNIEYSLSSLLNYNCILTLRLVLKADREPDSGSC